MEKAFYREILQRCQSLPFKRFGIEAVTKTSMTNENGEIKYSYKFSGIDSDYGHRYNIEFSYVDASGEEKDMKFPQSHHAQHAATVQAKLDLQMTSTSSRMAVTLCFPLWIAQYAKKPTLSLEQATKKATI